MYKLSKVARQAGTLVMLLLASTGAVPQQSGTRYTVEIVVFRTSSQSGALPGGAPGAAGSEDDVEPTAVATRKLSGAASRLRNSSGLRVLAHTAWTQAPISCANADCRALSRGVSAARLDLARAGISGKIILKRGQNLNLGIDLTVDDGGRRYRISEMRQKIKTDDAQYFDHPAIGVLAVVTSGG
ncbi:MAG: CsiV family protein [Steroidobacteraceae bacterium]